ncbi:tannase/feruloyl esterase family alpha/beta hydrolase [Brenneria sp. hezel4-2-4]|nr:tannase/feruloyl esterase family alpha/beta hydrolase [Brenneria sp. hezel4-2-4]
MAYSYFCGCSGGGRDTLVAASHFPEEFDGFVAGSAYVNLATKAFQGVGLSLASIRSPDALVSPALLKKPAPIINQKCDAIDGVKDGLIQNPMACDFRAAVDLPRCKEGTPGDTCFTDVQIGTVSTLLTAVTDENGHVVQPGFSLSDVQGTLLLPPENPGQPNPWPDAGNPATGNSGGMALLGDAVLRIFTHRNDPDFRSSSVVAFGNGGSGAVTLGQSGIQSGVLQ